MAQPPGASDGAHYWVPDVATTPWASNSTAGAATNLAAWLGPGAFPGGAQRPPGSFPTVGQPAVFATPVAAPTATGWPPAYVTTYVAVGGAPGWPGTTAGRRRPSRRVTRPLWPPGPPRGGTR